MTSLVVGVMLVAALQVLAQSRTAGYSLETRERGRALAEGLMREVMNAAYQDPESDADSLGLDAGELHYDRATFDDIDDYSGWVESPPTSRAGDTLDWGFPFRRSVLVLWADPADHDTVALAPSGLKKITVQVFLVNKPIETLVAYRSAAGDAAMEL